MIATFLIVYLIGVLLGVFFVFACAEAKRFSHRKRAPSHDGDHPSQPS